MSDNIRIVYSGVISFFIRFSSLLTGFIFTVIVTHKLSETDFGIWQIIQNAHSYTVFILPVVTYWTVRYIARNEDVGKTSLFFSLLLTIPASLIYFVISAFFSDTTAINFMYFAVAWIQIPIFFMIGTLESTSQGFKPQLIGYAFIVSEIIKIVFAVLLLVVFDGDIFSVLAIMIIMQAAQLMMLLIFNKNMLKDSFDFLTVKKWIKMGWLPLFTSLPALIYTLDVAIVISLTRSIESIAYYKIALIISNYIVYGQQLGIALYPKIIKGGKSEDVESILKITLMFLIPLSFGIYLLSDQLLFILKPSYMISQVAMYFLIPAAFLMVFLQIFDSIILGSEKIELQSKISIKNILNSKLFHIPLISLIQSILYIILLTSILFFITSKGSDEKSIILFWSITSLIAPIPIMIYKGILARKTIHFQFPKRNIIKYLFSVSAMIAALFLLKSFIKINSTVTGMVFLGAEVMIGISVYFGVLYLIEPELRKMIKKLI